MHNSDIELKKEMIDNDILPDNKIICQYTPDS